MTVNMLSINCLKVVRSRRRRRKLLIVALVCIIIIAMSQMAIKPTYDGRTLINTDLFASLVRNVADPIGVNIIGGAKPDAGEMRATGGDQGKFLVFPDLSKEEENSIIVYIPSRPADVERRNLIRLSWANSKYYSMRRDKLSIVAIFSVGLSCQTSDKHNCTNGLEIMSEVESLRDMLLLNMSDTYANLVHKVRLTMEWIQLYSTAKYIFKLDDDIIPNIFVLSRIVQELDARGSSCFVLGYPWLNGRPDRNVLGKFHVSKEEYSPDVFPKYIIGGGYLMSRDAMATILDVTSQTPTFKLEDVYFNGLSVKPTDIHLLGIPDAALKFLPPKSSSGDITKVLNNINETLMVHHVPSDNWWKVWEAFKLFNYGALTNDIFKLRDVTDVNTTVPERWMINRNNISNICKYKYIDLDGLM